MNVGQENTKTNRHRDEHKPRKDTNTNTNTHENERKPGKDKNKYTEE